MDKLDLLAQIQHTLTLLARAIQQPDSGHIQEGDLLQIAPGAHPLFAGYFLYARYVTHGRARGPLLTTHRGAWCNLPLEHCARIGRRVFPEPQHGYQADPIRAAGQRQAINDDHAARAAAIARKRAATIAAKSARLKTG